MKTIRDIATFFRLVRRGLHLIYILGSEEETSKWLAQEVVELGWRMQDKVVEKAHLRWEVGVMGPPGPSFHNKYRPAISCPFEVGDILIDEDVDEYRLDEVAFPYCHLTALSGTLVPGSYTTRTVLMEETYKKKKRGNDDQSV